MKRKYLFHEYCVVPTLRVSLESWQKEGFYYSVYTHIHGPCVQSLKFVVYNLQYFYLP